VLPSARSGFIGGPAITVFASVINATAGTARNCRVVIPGTAPVTLSYQQTDATNTPILIPDQVFNIDANQNLPFILTFTPTATSAGEEVFPDFICDNANVGQIPGVNTVFIAVDTVAGSDVLSINATPSGDGIVAIPSGGANFMTASAVNIGSILGRAMRLAPAMPPLPYRWIPVRLPCQYCYSCARRMQLLPVSRRSRPTSPPPLAPHPASLQCL